MDPYYDQAYYANAYKHTYAPTISCQTAHLAIVLILGKLHSRKTSGIKLAWHSREFRLADF